jgi:hypothetical protein
MSFRPVPTDDRYLRKRHLYPGVPGAGGLPISEKIASSAAGAAVCLTSAGADPPGNVNVGEEIKPTRVQRLAALEPEGIPACREQAKVV